MFKRQILAVSVLCLWLGMMNAHAQATYEYWLDSDHSNRKIGTVDADGDISLTIALESVSPGLHCFNFRASNAKGMGAVTRKMFYYAPELAIKSEKLTYYEYWIDGDYENHIPVETKDGAISISYDLTSLSPGLHTFNFRPVGEGVSIGSVTRKMFYYAPELAIASEQMASYEYWLDNDYTARKTVNASNGTITLDIALEGMKSGLHTFNFRPIGQGNSIGAVTRKMFYYTPELSIASEQMASYEYWIDNNYTARQTAKASNGTIALDIALEGMKSGLHTFNFRPIGQGNSIGAVTRKMFYIAPEDHIYPTVCEYWIDGEDPTSKDVLGKTTIELDVDISELDQTSHLFNIRTMSADGTWGPVHQEQFVIDGLPLDATEFASLKVLQAELKGMGWLAPWDMSAGPEAAVTFDGVKMREGHIVGFDFSNKGLNSIEKSMIPLTMFINPTSKTAMFPELKSINLSGNNLAGGIDMVLAGIATTCPESVAKLETLNLSNNKFSGNVGILSKLLPSLTTLDVSENGFGDVYPAVSKSVTSLSYGKQTIEDRIVPINFADLQTLDEQFKILQEKVSDMNPAAVTNPSLMDPEVKELLAKLPPTITLYQHKYAGQYAGTWLPLNAYLFTTADVQGYKLDATDDWAVAVGWDTYGYCMPYVSDKGYLYKGDNGQILNAIMIYQLYQAAGQSKWLVEGTNFKVKLTYPDGDVNFDGVTNVTDLQSIVNYILELYQVRNDLGQFKPFNFTEANRQNEDEVIDVKDAVRMVNLLLGLNSSTQSPARVPGRVRTDSMPRLAYNANGELFLTSSKPVAAFELTIAGTDDVYINRSLTRMGFTCEIQNHKNGITRVVVYSLGGSTLPAGTTAVGYIGKNEVTSAVLSDEYAEAITEPALTTGINRPESYSAQASIAYNGTNIVVNTGVQLSNATWTVSSVDGMILSQGVIDSLPSGCSEINCGPLANGVVIITLDADEIAPQRRKVMIAK